MPASESLFVSGLQLTLHLVWPFIVAIVGGAIVAGVFRVSTQINDAAIGFAGRVSALGIMLFFYGSSAISQLLSFAQRLWGGADFY